MNDSFIILMRRFAELLITSIIVSGVITFLNKMGILTKREHIIPILLIGAVIFFAINVNMQRNCYYDMGKNHIEYYILNAMAYILFIVVSCTVYVFCSKEVYTWLFAITKWIRFTVNRVDTYFSAFVFHVIGLASVFLSPAGVITENFDDR